MILIQNKKVRLNFSLVETVSAGIELFGNEVKSLRAKMGSLQGARVVVRGGEAYLIGMTIPPFQVANAPKDYDPERPRRLLLKKAEIAQLLDAEETKGLTSVPFEVYNNKYIKVRIAIARGKKKVDKREDLKKKQDARETARVLKRK